MFKEHLTNHVTSSLTDLEEFIKVSGTPANATGLTYISLFAVNLS